MAKFRASDFLVKPGTKHPLKFPTHVKPYFKSEEETVQALKKGVDSLAELQTRLFAQGKHSVLLVFQGMDTAGKDGVISHVIGGLNPQSFIVHSFKAPDKGELARDFLWRCHSVVPRRGHLGIFNRSYYEEVIVTRVHPELLETQNLPDECLGGEDFWDDRLKDISHFEKYLRRQGVVILKFFLHLSKEEQRNRLLARIDEPEKHWKFDPADMKERKKWNEFHKAYDECVSATSSSSAPWFVVPADDKPTARYIVSQILVSALEDLKLGYPKVSIELRKELEGFAKELRQ
jgi:PPK2 family polyphosphate:nucleotide phosphotransferase